MIRARKGRTLSIITSMLGLVGCTNLEFLESNTCGNLVVESDIGEDCDGEAGCGAPRSAHECRFTCETEPSDCKEDLGYHCGADGVCRRPTGEFVPASTDTTATARDMLVGDVNADGCAEVIVSAMRSTTVYAFSSSISSSCVASEQTLQTNRPDPEKQNLPQPALVDFTPTDTSSFLSLLAPTASLFGDGLSLHYTNGSPKLTPVLFPKFQRGGSTARTLSAKFHGRDAVVLVEQSAMGKGSDVSVIFDPQKPVDTFPSAFSDNVSNIAAIIAADVYTKPMEPPEGACDEIIIGRKGSSLLEVYEMCTGNMTYGFDKVPNAQITLTNAQVRESTARIVAVDMNGDQYLDLLTNASDEKVHVAYGAADGRFHSQPMLPMPPALPDQKAGVLDDPMATEAARNGHIFVALEFDPNHSGIDFYGPPCPPVAEFSSPTCSAVTGGCEAVVADIDGDLDDDVVISEGQSVDLAIHRQTEGSFNVTFLETSCPPHYLSAGDFDGDGVVDIAFFDQTSKAPKENTMSLSIAYGNAFAAPSVPVPSGRFDEATGTSVVHFGPQGSQSPNALLAMTRDITRKDKTKASALGIVEIGSERTVSAPYYVAPEMMGAQTSESLTLVAQAVGQFSQHDNQPARPAVAVLTHSTSMVPNLWLLEPDEDASSMRSSSTGESSEIPCDGSCMLVAIPQGGTLKSELLLLGAGKGAIYEANAGFVMKSSFDLKHDFSTLITAKNPFKYAPRPIVDDLDGDGFKDALVLASTGALVGFFGDAQGTFTEAEIIPAPKCWGTKGCANYAPVQIDVNGDAKLDLVIAGSELPSVKESVSIAAYDIVKEGNSRRLEPISGITIHAETLESDVDYAALGADDIDADGVTDLVFMPSSNYFTVLRGRPEHE